MNAVFNVAAKYLVHVTCASPLRSGTYKGDLQEILRRWDGMPIIQGASLAGALRGWQDDEKLFGSINGEGELTFSDMVFSELKTDIRPRLRINGHYGTVASDGKDKADKGQKFDIVALPSGTQGICTILWKGCIPQERRNDEAKQQYIKENTEKLEAYLAAMNAGQIRLGAQRSNGYGIVSIDVKRRVFDLQNEEDRKAWLDDAQPFESITLPNVTIDRMMRFAVTAQTDGLLVKASVGDGIGSKGTDAKNLRDNNHLIIPGSSIRGAIRAKAEDILRQLRLSDTIKPEHLFGCTDTEDQGGAAGIVLFRDAQVEKEAKKTSRNRINRFTSGVMGSGLFSETPVCGEVNMEVLVPAHEEKACALILFALRDLGLGMYNLGSGNNIGRGRLENMVITVSVENKQATLKCINGSAVLDDPDKLTLNWISALKQQEVQHED